MSDLVPCYVATLYKVLAIGDHGEVSPAEWKALRQRVLDYDADKGYASLDEHLGAAFGRDWRQIRDTRERDRALIEVATILHREHPVSKRQLASLVARALADYEQRDWKVDQPVGKPSRDTPLNRAMFRALRAGSCVGDEAIRKLLRGPEWGCDLA